MNLKPLLSSQVFVGLGFPYEGPAPIEAIALGCVFLQPHFNPPHSSDNNDFYKGKPTTRQVWRYFNETKKQLESTPMGCKCIDNVGSQISSQHPYAETSIGKPHVWTVDVTNKSDVREALRSILHTEVVNRPTSGLALYKCSGTFLLVVYVLLTVAAA